ncbi:MAG: galactokinase, partial [Chloroflexi bacterium]
MSSGHQLDERVRQLFKQTYNYPPTAVTVAPGRMNVIGEHTDYNDGFVLPAAIDRFVAVAARQRRDGGIQLISDRYSAPVTLEALPAVRRGDWADYVIGVGRQL